MYTRHMNIITKLSAISLGLIFLAGCSSNSSLSGMCLITTPWGSCIDENGIDSGLLGVWQLTDQTLTTPAGTITNPYHGRTLTFKIESIDVPDPTDPDLTITEIFGMYIEQWAPETSTGDKDVTTPSEGIATSECTVTGATDGIWSTWSGSDFDNPNPDGSYPVLNELEIAPNSEGGPQVVCSAGGVDVSATAGTTPLGTGPGTFAVAGGGVIYTYTIAPAEAALILVNINPYSNVTNTLTFKRLTN